MRRAAFVLGVVLACLPAAGAVAAIDRAWTGWWVLDRSQKEPEGAADDYRFTVLPDGRLRWEIPSLHEDFPVQVGGPPAAVQRPGAPHGMTLRVWAEAPRVLRYEAAIPGRPAGGGRMTLSPDAKSWTDVPVNTATGAEADDLTMTYVKK